MRYTYQLVILGDAHRSIPAPALYQLSYMAGEIVLSGHEYEERVAALRDYLHAENQRELRLHVRVYRNDNYTIVRVYNDALVDVCTAISTGVEEANR